MGSASNGDSKMLALLQKLPSNDHPQELTEGDSEVAGEGEAEDELGKWSFTNWIYPTN